MASNEYVIPEHYEDLTPAPQLDQKTLNKMAWRSCFLQASFNYERMQAAGWLYSIIPGLEKIHTNKNDLAASMSHNLEFFNTHPFLVTFVMGIVLSLEQNKVDIPTIRAVRVAAMGPLGGIGDALFWLTLVPITAGITSNMAINGNAAAPIIFLVIFNVVQFALRFWLMNWSYKLGTSAIDALTANMQAFTRAASIMGVFVVGCLVVTMGGTRSTSRSPTAPPVASPTTVIVSEKEAENFTGMEGIDTETAEAGTIAMTDEDGNALTATDADGNEVSAASPIWVTAWSP
ncbi:MAG: PTS system mannose/fructose/sorbose family transporter subunit IID [Collinsella sp.]